MLKEGKAQAMVSVKDRCFNGWGLYFGSFEGTIDRYSILFSHS